ncbi:D-alanyl-D-alanine carboxypeptidase/D-alanyl-D-alanine-endopeptidase [Fredinandcohnia humi]
MKRTNKMIILALLLITAITCIHWETLSVDAVTSQNPAIQQIHQYLLNEPHLSGAIAGISVRSAKTGEIIYEHAGNIRLRPASNLKLLTAATALSSLGEEYRFRTYVLTDGSLVGNKLEGNLYLKGGGDPTLLQSDFDLLAKKIKKSGVDVVFGNLIADDTWYDDERYSIDLTWSDETYYYGSAVSGLTASPNKDYDSGTVIIEISPGREVGEKARIKVTPSTNYVKVTNLATTVNENEKKSLSINREHGTNLIMIEGSIPLNSLTTKEWIAVWEPTGYALDMFKQALAKQDIHVIGADGIGKTPEKARVIATNKSIPLRDLLVPFMKLSNNGHGETLVKEMGRLHKGEGDWEKGLEVVKEELARLGIDSSRMVLRDGSGISHVNLVSANDISRLLYIAQKQKWFPSFEHSLPVAGNNERMIGGSLRNRLKSPDMVGKIKAKTGTIRTVSSLSGYIETRSGEQLIFSILLNNLMDDAYGKPIEDRIVTMLFEY